MLNKTLSFINYLFFLIGTCIVIIFFMECGVAYVCNGPMRLVKSLFTRPAQFIYQPYELWTSPANTQIRQRSGEATIGPDGYRIVPYDTPPAKESLKVFLFGGSTMWGTGVGDRETIAFYIAQELGAGYRVVNMGERGFNSVQELNRFMRVVAQGDSPSIAVFYDGINDTFSGVFSPAIPRSHHYFNEF